MTSSNLTSTNPRTRVIVTAIICVTALVWGVFIWPTPYRYEKVTRPFYDINHTIQEVYRINRFTGYSEVVKPIRPQTK